MVLQNFVGAEKFERLNSDAWIFTVNDFENLEIAKIFKIWPSWLSMTTIW